MSVYHSNDGTAIACTTSGSGPPLLVVHGSGADSARWARVAPALGARFTVHAVDRRGRGASGDGPSYALAREAEDLVAVLDGLGGPVDVLAHSFGAICALAAAPAAAALHRLIVYEPPIGVVAPGIEALEARLAAGDRDAVVAAFFTNVAHVPVEQLALMRAMPAWEARVAAAHTIPRELRAQANYVPDDAALAPLGARVVLLAGGASPPPVRAATEKLHASLPGSRIISLPGQQHVAMDTDPQAFVSAVLSALRGGD